MISRPRATPWRDLLHVAAPRAERVAWGAGTRLPGRALRPVRVKRGWIFVGFHLFLSLFFQVSLPPPQSARGLELRHFPFNVCICFREAIDMYRHAAESSSDTSPEREKVRGFGASPANAIISRPSTVTPYFLFRSFCLFRAIFSSSFLLASERDEFGSSTVITTGRSGGRLPGKCVSE